MRSFPSSCVRFASGILSLLVACAIGRPAAAACTWQTFAVPNLSTGAYASNALTTIAPISDNDVWASGITTSATESGVLDMFHFDGARWSVVATPNLPPHSYFIAMKGNGANNVWAVGQDQMAGTPEIAHFDGTSWNVVPGATASRQGQLNSVAVLGPYAWAAGGGIMERFNGVHWEIDHFAPGALPQHAIFSSIGGNSILNLWAGGEVDGAGYYPQVSPFLLHYDPAHSRWAAATLPPPAERPISISAVSSDFAPTTSNAQIWVAGTSGIANRYVDVWNGSTWSEIQPLVPSVGGVLSLDATSHLGYVFAQIADSTNGFALVAYSRKYGTWTTEHLAPYAGKKIPEVVIAAVPAPSDNVWAAGEAAGSTSLSSINAAERLTCLP